ncbi:MAG: ABC transporter substrate-binding protein [Parabacteroides distasonis]|nr:ABC transporter substrate-binding protein [Parabacteroides distasonis]
MKLILRYWIGILYLFGMIACSHLPQTSTQECSSSDTIRYAKGFTVQRFEKYISVEVHDPWDSTRLLQRYLLVDRNRVGQVDLPSGTVVPVPIQNIVVHSSVHTAIIDQLGETGRIIGVYESRYIDTPAVQEGIKNGRIVDMGEATTPNIELMIDRGVELVIVSPFQNSGYGTVEKLGIPIIEGADYMESLPLGRTEWIRFYGLLFGKEELADSIFRETEKRYLDLSRLTAKVSARPTVFSEKRYGASWFMPAGESYMAHLFRDAGADYLFQYLPGSGSKPLPFEKVLNEAIHADRWLIKYHLSEEMTYDDLRMEYTPYEYFDAFKKGQIYTCNTGLVPYYEEFPLHPDYLLADLIWIFHPDLLPEDYLPRYYRKMTF